MFVYVPCLSIYEQQAVYPVLVFCQQAQHGKSIQLSSFSTHKLIELPSQIYRANHCMHPTQMRTFIFCATSGLRFKSFFPCSHYTVYSLCPMGMNLFLDNLRQCGVLFVFTRASQESLQVKALITLGLLVISLVVEANLTSRMESCAPSVNLETGSCLFLEQIKRGIKRIQPQTSQKVFSWQLVYFGADCFSKNREQGCIC